jgi:acetyl esterase/lipase
VALLKRKFGAHLSDAAKGTLAGRRPYPGLAAVRNPLTRPLARRIAESDWLATFDQLDFGYSFEDCSIGGVSCVAYRPEQTKANAPLILYIHAGGFVCGSARANATAVLPTCHLSGCNAIAVDYSLAPEFVFPTQLIEIETVYRTLISSGHSPDRIIVIGDSAGGALALSSLYRWRRLGLPMPAGLALLSPILDAHAESDTHLALKGRDPLFAANGAQNFAQCFRIYAGAGDCADPEVSPLAGDPSGLPPALLHVGTREVLLGDSARFSEKARQAGVDVSLRVFDGMFHLFHQHWRLAEARIAHQDIAEFIGKAAR